MAEMHLDTHAPSFQQDIKELAEDLLRKIDDGDLGKVVEVVNSINDVRDRTLYEEIGKLTRGLHEAIKNLKAGDELSEQTGMVQASDKLSYVMEMTDKAANKTMDLVEEGMPLNSEIQGGAEELHEEWQKFLRKELAPDDFRILSKKIDKYLLKTPPSS